MLPHRAWLDGPLREHTGVASPPPQAWLDLAQLVAADSPLEAMHAALCRDRSATSQAAAKWVVGWSAGSLAGAVGFGLATARVGLVPRAEGLRWGVHRGGWFDRVDLGDPDVVVAADHPWAGEADVTVVADQHEVRARAVAALVAVAQPLVARTRRLARVGSTTLWAEIGDALGLALLDRVDLPATASVVTELRAAVQVPDAPWRTRPRIDLADAGGAGGVVLVGQKSGCCLAYQCPPPGSEPEYCSTCSLVPHAECVAVQLAARRR